MTEMIMNKAAHTTLLAALLGGLLLTSGCFSVDTEFAAIRDQAFSALPGQYDTDTEFAIGNGVLSLASLGMESSEEKESWDRAMSKVKKIQVGIYKRQPGAASNSASWDVDHPALRRMNQTLAQDRWEPIVRVFEQEEAVSIFIHSSPDGRIDDLLIVVLEPHESVVLHLKGGVEELVAALATHRDFELPAG